MKNNKTKQNDILKLTDLSKESLLKLQNVINEWYNSLDLKNKTITEIDNFINYCEDSINFIENSSNINTLKNKCYIGSNYENGIIIFKIKDIVLNHSINDEYNRIAYCYVNSLFIEQNWSYLSINVKYKENYINIENDNNVIIYINNKNQVCTQTNNKFKPLFFLCKEINEDEYNNLMQLNIQQLQSHLLTDNNMRNFVNVQI